MQNILVPVDFSPASDNALAFAAQLAQAYHARLLVFHAYMLPTPVSEVPYILITADELQQENEKIIRRQVDDISTKYKVEASPLVRIGIASDEIKTLTEDDDIDLIVMGMKGAGGLGKLIGSTTTNVLHKVKTPVLIVPQDAVYKPIASLTYASDFTYQTNISLFDPLLSLVKKFEPAITILHVQTEHAGESPDLVAGKKENNNIFQGHLYNFVTVENNSVTAGIQQFQAENNSDLLVMVARQHGFFERLFSQNHTDAMAYETHTPMLVLQDKN